MERVRAPRRPAGPWLLAGALAAACGDDLSAATAASDTGTAGETGAASETGDPPEIDGVMVDLVQPHLWQPLAAADDPRRDHRPDTVTCPLGPGYLIEPDGFEVNTNGCNYAAFTQPTLAPIVPGAQIALDFYHFDLVAPAPATAHVLVLAGDHVLFEREIAVPGDAFVYDLDFVADFDLPAGAPAVLHLHNHGQNTWTLAQIQVEVADMP